MEAFVHKFRHLAIHLKSWPNDFVFDFVWADVQPCPSLHWSYLKLLAFHAMYTVWNRDHKISQGLAQREPKWRRTNKICENISNFFFWKKSHTYSSNKTLSRTDNFERRPTMLLWAARCRLGQTLLCMEIGHVGNGFVRTRNRYTVTVGITATLWLRLLLLIYCLLLWLLLLLLLLLFVRS